LQAASGLASGSAGSPELRVAVVVNPRSRARARLRARSLERLRESVRVVAELDTRGAAADGERLAALVTDLEPDVLVAAGGDGTAGLALRALLETKRAERTALAFLPLGTGNNAARSFGLSALRDGDAALARAVAAIVSGPRRTVDAGLANDRPFLGSFTLGMDADLLALRNRLHRRLEPRGIEGGYSLYLGSFAASLLRGAHGGRAQLWLDGVRESCALYNLAIVNAPIYAGPFRFDGANDCADGLLDVHALASAGEYLTEYPGAWLRYLRVERGVRVAPSPRLRRAREIRVELERPVAAQSDGEALAAAASFQVRVLPGALRVCLPDS
jgi:diacylglycerol kinase (ATP)